MNEAVGGYIRKKDGAPLCVHCADDHVRGCITLSLASLNPKLSCVKCERTLIDARNEPPPSRPPEDKAQLELEEDEEFKVDMPDVFGADVEEAPKKKRRQSRRKKKAADADS